MLKHELIALLLDKEGTKRTHMLFKSRISLPQKYQPGYISDRSQISTSCFQLNEWVQNLFTSNIMILHHKKSQTIHKKLINLYKMIKNIFVCMVPTFSDRQISPTFPVYFFLIFSSILGKIPGLFQS